MSTTKLFRAGLIATVGVAGLTLTANAQSRYGNVYDYESGRNCGQACVPAAPVSAPATSRYGAPVVAAPTYNPAPVYVDCVQAGTCAPRPSVVYTQPAAAPVYTQPAYTAPAQTYTPAPTYTQSVQMEAANCPAGTTAQSDGTCMQSGSTSSYSSSTTYSAPTTSYAAPSMSMEPVNCPSGTTAQADGTCMQTGSSYSSSTTYSGSTYSEPTPSYSSATSYSAPSSYSSEPVNCPAGTTAQADGTCMQGGSSAFAGSSIELYTGDAASSTQSYTPSTTYGYGADGSYGSSDYLPIRK